SRRRGNDGAGGADGAHLARPVFVGLLHRTRDGRPLLAPRRPRLDLPLSAAVPDLGDAVENQPEGKQHAEAHSAKPYVVVWVMLMGLTLLTWITGTMHLQHALPVAVAIALTKSALVVLIFMHMNEA